MTFLSIFDPNLAWNNPAFLEKVERERFPRVTTCPSLLHHVSWLLTCTVCILHYLLLDLASAVCVCVCVCVSELQCCVLPMWSEFSRWQYLSDLNNDTRNIVTLKHSNAVCPRGYNVSKPTDETETRTRTQPAMALAFSLTSREELHSLDTRTDS